jgi:transposase
MAKIEILTGAERQRRWSTENKLSILREAFSADGN